MQAVEYLQWWGAHYPHTNPRNSLYFQTLLVGADQSHVASGKITCRRQGRDRDWPQASQEGMWGRKLGLAASRPFYPQQPVPQMDFCPLSPHQTGHSAPVSHPNIVLSLPSVPEGGRRAEEEGKKVQALTILEILPHVQLFLTIVFGHGGHIREPRAAGLVQGCRPHCGVQCWL